MALFLCSMVRVIRFGFNCTWGEKKKRGKILLKPEATQREKKRDCLLNGTASFEHETGCTVWVPSFGGRERENKHILGKAFTIPRKEDDDEQLNGFIVVVCKTMMKDCFVGTVSLCHSSIERIRFVFSSHCAACHCHNWLNHTIMSLAFFLPDICHGVEGRCRRITESCLDELNASSYTRDDKDRSC